MNPTPESPSWLWVFDVDATLVDAMAGESLRPRSHELLTLLSRNEVRLIAWSAGGAEYAQRKLSAAGVAHYFAEFRGKGERTNGFYDTSFAQAWGVFVDDQPGDLPPAATVFVVRPYLAPNPNDTGLDPLFASAPSGPPTSATRPIHPMHGTHLPRRIEPAISPNSIRRVTRIDSLRPDGVLGPVHMYAYGHDELRTADGTASILNGVVLKATIGFSDGRRLESLHVTSSGAEVSEFDQIPELGSLVGLSVASGFRAAVDRVWPGGGTSHSVLYQLLDDLPTAALVSGYAIGAAGVKMRPNQPRSQYPDLCAGFASDAFMIREQSATGLIPMPTGPDAPVFTITWRDLSALPPHGLRRLRCIDVAAHDTLGFTVENYFRDSHADALGNETVVHEYTVDTTFNTYDASFGITEATPHSLPWVECPLAAASAERLQDTPASGLRRHVRNNYTGRSTCTHLNDTLRALEDVPHLIGLTTR